MMTMSISKSVKPLLEVKKEQFLCFITKLRIINYQAVEKGINSLDYTD